MQCFDRKLKHSICIRQ